MLLLQEVNTQSLYHVNLPVSGMRLTIHAGSLVPTISDDEGLNN